MTIRRVQMLTAVPVGLGLLLGGLTGCGPTRPQPLTLAFTATSAEPAPSVAGLRDLLTKHAGGAVLPDDGAVQVLAQGGQVATSDLTPMRGKEVENDKVKADGLIAANLTTLNNTLGRLKAATPGLDVLGTLDRALAVTPNGGTVVLGTSFLSTVAPLDLTRAGAWTTAPGRLAQAVNQRHLPDARGRTIVFVGLGYPAGAQPVPGTAARAALEELATKICIRTGAANCTVVPGPVGHKKSDSTRRVPKVPLGQVTTTCVIGSTELSADVLFPPNSAVLSARADRVLAPIARSLKTCPAGRKVDAIGHYAEVPGGGDGRSLSKQRAKAVLKRLRQLGAPPAVIGRAVGCGGPVPCQLVDNTPNGRYVESLAKKNRVVELTTTHKKEA